MAFSYAASLKTTRMTDVKDAIDAGSGAGTLEIATTSFGTILATHTLADPCGSVSGSVLTFSAISDVTIANSGTAAVARIKDSDGNVVVNNLSVATSGGDVTVGSTTYTAGNTSHINDSGTFTHA
jgi:hypothetical protein